jgi:hypothetical protein
MDEWVVGVIAAGSAVAGSIVTGWFTRSAGTRQAEAARHAGDRQADALLATVQASLDEQRRARAQDIRRQVYVQLIQVGQMPRGSARERREAEQRAQEVLSLIHLEGPSEVVAAAGAFVTGMAEAWDEHDLWVAERPFLLAARRALDIADE